MHHKYCTQKDWTKTTVSVTIHLPVSRHQKNLSPGPGTYDALKSFKNVNKVPCTRIKKDSLVKDPFARFERPESPAPGHYDQSEPKFSSRSSLITLKGKPNYPKPTFTPGPGSYFKHPLAFGQFLSRVKSSSSFSGSQSFSEKRQTRKN